MITVKLSLPIIDNCFFIFNHNVGIYIKIESVSGWNDDIQKKSH